MIIREIPEEEKKQKPQSLNQHKNNSAEISGIITGATSRDGAKAYRITPRNMARRYSSEKQLELIVDWEFEDGNSYHVISQGDIDSLTYLRHIIKQQIVPEVLISTWCMSVSDILEIESWINNGRIGKVKFYCGEIFKGSYMGEYAELKRLTKQGVAEMCIFRNHSKVMAGHGNEFSFVVESSANVNTNPRCENTVITIDKGLCDFYFDFYSKINSIDS